MKLMKKTVVGAMVCSLLGVQASFYCYASFNRVVNENGSLEQLRGCPTSDHEYALLREIERQRAILESFFAKRRLITLSPAQVQNMVAQQVKTDFFNF